MTVPKYYNKRYQVGTYTNNCRCLLHNATEFNDNCASVSRIGRLEGFYFLGTQQTTTVYNIILPVTK